MSVTLTSDIYSLTAESKKRHMRSGTNIFGGMVLVTQKAPGDPVVVEKVNANGYRSGNPRVLAMLNMAWEDAITTITKETT